MYSPHQQQAGPAIKTPGTTAGRFRDWYDRVGLKVARDCTERSAEFGADGGHGRHRGHGDQGRNQTVLDRGCAVLVLEEFDKRGKHAGSPAWLTGQQCDLMLEELLNRRV